MRSAAVIALLVVIGWVVVDTLLDPWVQQEGSSFEPIPYDQPESESQQSAARDEAEGLEIATIQARSDKAARAPLGDRAPQPSDSGDVTPTAVRVQLVRGSGTSLGGSLPLTAVDVELFLRDSPKTIFGKGRSDGDGLVVIEVPRRQLEPGRSGLTPVMARIVDPRYLSTPRSVRLVEKDGESNFRVTLAGVEGWIQPVQVLGALDPDVSKPVRLMRLSTRKSSFSSRNNSQPALREDSHSRVRARAGGLFEIEVAQSTDPRFVIVDGGSGGRASAELKPRGEVGKPAEIMHLELQGEGRLKGVVLDSANDPALPLRLYAILQPSGGGPTFDGFTEPVRSQLMQRGEGQFYGRTTTAEDGSFSFEGLVPGRYRMLAELPGAEDEHGYKDPKYDLLGVTTAAADVEPVVLRYNRPTIIVEMRTEASEEVASLTLFDAGPIGADPWVQGSARAWEVPLANPFATHRAPFKRGNHDVLTDHFDVVAGRQYILVAKWPVFDRTLRVVEVPAHDAKVSVTIDAIELPVGEVEVHARLAELTPDVHRVLTHRPEEVEGEDGSEAPKNRLRWIGGPTLAIFLEDPVTGLPILQKTWEGDASGRHGFNCPVGPVRVVACALPLLERYHGTLSGPRFHGRVERIIEVKSGVRERVSLEIPIGGALKVEVKGSISEMEEARAFADVQRRYALGEYFDMEDSERLLQAELFIEDAARHIREPVTREARPIRGSKPTGIHITNGWPLGETHGSIALPSGEYTLVAMFPNRSPIRTRVSIRSGEVTPVRIDFGE